MYRLMKKVMCQLLIENESTYVRIYFLTWFFLFFYQPDCTGDNDDGDYYCEDGKKHNQDSEKKVFFFELHRVIRARISQVLTLLNEFQTQMGHRELNSTFFYSNFYFSPLIQFNNLDPNQLKQ